MTDRKTLDQMTSDDLDELYEQRDRAQRIAMDVLDEEAPATETESAELRARIATLEHVAKSNLRHVQLIVPDLERAEAAIERVRHLAARIRQGAPWTANDDDIAAHILTALDEPAPGPDPSGVANAVAALAKHVQRAADYRQSDFALTTDAPAAPVSGPATTQATELRTQLADILRNTPRTDSADWPRPTTHGAGHRYDGRCALCTSDIDALTEAVAAAILPATRITATLARDSEATVSRVIDLYERWVKAGPPPLGASLSRWWDQRLVELHDAILNPTKEQPS
jgi:hypothetical protein